MDEEINLGIHLEQHIQIKQIEIFVEKIEENNDYDFETGSRLSLNMSCH